MFNPRKRSSIYHRSAGSGRRASSQKVITASFTFIYKRHLAFNLLVPFCYFYSFSNNYHTLRRRQRGERLRFEEFESELGEAFGYECNFPLPESMVFRLERGFENNGLRSPMGIVAFEGASADTKLVAVANTHCGSGELEFMQIKHGQISLIFKLPVNGVDCQEPTAVTALKKNGLAFLDKCKYLFHLFRA